MNQPATSTRERPRAISSAVRRAIVRERERCAKIAESVGQETGDGEGEFYIARKIATAIRKPLL